MHIGLYSWLTMCRVCCRSLPLTYLTVICAPDQLKMAVVHMPDEVTEHMQAVQQTMQHVSGDMEQLITLLRRSQSRPQTPLERAETLQALSQLACAVYQLHVRTCGIDASADEPIQKEGQRQKSYHKKVNKAVAAEILRTSRPTISLDVGAANRFINHAIPDLSQQQKAALQAATESVKRKAEQLDEQRQGKQESAQAKRMKGSQGRQQPKLQPVSAKEAAVNFLAQLKQNAEKEAVGVSLQTPGAGVAEHKL